jgi:hypothetical protein
VNGEAFTEVTMHPFEGGAVAKLAVRRAEVAEAGNEYAPYILCSISSGAPRALFERMPLEDYLSITEFMQPHFEMMGRAMGNAAKAQASKSKASSN